MHGGNGTHIEYHVMRHAPNPKTANTCEGTRSLGRAQNRQQAVV